MKKLFTFLSLMLFALVGYGQGTETFDNICTSGCSPSSSSYGSRSWTGDDGSTWTATKSRTDQTINGNAMCMNDDVANTYVLSGTISGGIGDISIKTQRKYSGGSGTMNVEINGSNVGTIAYSGTSATSTISGINVSGDFTIKILNDIGGSSSGGADRVAIDDITWTAYASTNSSASDIIKTSSWSEPTNIDYTAYSATSGLTAGTSANSIEVASFTIRDGGTTTDGDAVGTKLTALSVDVTNYFDLEALAVFDGTTNVAEVTGISGGSGTVSFTGLAINTTDGGTKDFTLRATFSATVNDNDNIKYAISSATADASGSDFAASDAGAAATDDTGNNNKIVVTGDRFEFMPGQTNVTVGQDFMVDIQAVDVNGNADMDATPSVTIATGSTGTGTISSATGVTQSMSGGFIEYTDVQYDVIEDFTIEASASGYTSTTSGTYTAGGDFESNIVKKSGWSEPTNIDYTLYDDASSLTTTNAIEVAKFTIQDGGDDHTDDDNVGTKMIDLDITVDNWENIKTLAIFEGLTNKGEVSVASGSVSFSSITGGIEAADEGTKDFSIYATFNNSVTDNQNIQITIATPTADASGSTFDGGAASASTDNTGDNNKIVVTASKLAFTANKPGSTVTKSTDFEVEVKAVDDNDNVDLDMVDPVEISVGSGTGTLSSATGLTQNLVSGVYNWTDVQYDVEEDFTIAASVTGLTAGITGTITCAAGAPDLIISEVADPKDQYKARFVELYNGSGSTIDFSTSTFYLSKQSNGSSWADIQLSGTLAAGDMYVVAYNTSDFNSAYGFNPDKANGYISGNGNDGYFLYYGGDHSSGTLVDQYGVINEDGTGKSWEYTDSRVVRKTSVVKSGSKAAHTFDIADWTITDPANVADMTPGTKDAGQTLPVKYLSFIANTSNDVVILKWQTASEENNDYFSVERSYNAKDFEEVAQVQGAGNSNQIQNYKFVDQNADVSQSVYYRLKQIDYNGVYTYSDIVAVNAPLQGFKLNKSYSLNGELNLEINSNFNTHSQLQLMDITGKMLYSRSLNIDKGMHNYGIRLANYASGIYFIRITTENGINVQDKLILQ